MEYDLDKIKLGLAKPLTQVTIFRLDGQLEQSCNTLIKLSAKSNLYQEFDFLACLEEYFHQMEVGEEIRLNPVDWKEKVEGFYVVRLSKVDRNTMQWILFDKSGEKERMQLISLGRDRAVLRADYLHIEKELLEFKNAELARIQKFKERFFAAISHEMRTPLNSITGLVKLLEWSDPKAIYDYLHALKSTSQHLNHIINDVLDLSKIEEGKLILEHISFDLKDICRVILGGFGIIAQEKGIALEAKIDEGVPRFIKTDPTRMSQILYNLISNALKFTKEGGVILKVGIKGEFLYFEVADTGIGMSEKSIANILQPYVQAEGQSYREFGGTGLGMTIVNELVKVMGGELNIESEPDKGTTISFDLPYELAQEASFSIDDHYDPAANVDASSYSFLFAEDDAISNMIMKERSAKWNLNSTFVTTANDLEVELNEVKHDVLISDLHLEDDYAPDLLFRLRKRDSVNRDIPIIFLSGDAVDRHPNLNELSNWTYLVKPVNPRELSVKIRQMLKINLENTLPGVDLTVLSNASANDKAFMKELINTILETLPDEIEKLGELIASNQLFDAAKVLHKIKPSVSYFGITSLNDERTAIHDKAKKGLEIKEDFRLFKTRINIALESLAAKKLEL